MKFKNVLKNVVTSSFVFAFSTIMLAAIFKIAHLIGAEKIILTGLVLAIVYITTAIYEVRTSTQINSTEKNLWTVGLIFTTGLGGLIYFFIGRRRIYAKM